MRLVGPILYFRGQDGDRWHLSALIVDDGDREPQPLDHGGDGSPASPVRLERRHGRTLWRYDFALTLGEAPADSRYALGDEAWTVRLPARGGGRRFAYAACNGIEGDSAGEPGRNILWVQLGTEHAREPFHLLLQGGDQLYADSIWDKVPELGEWRKLPWRRGDGVEFTASMAEAADRYYFDRYCWLWSQAALAPVIASVPSVMMWDDHDIFDGWGSWPEERQTSPVFQGIFAAARQNFSLFQLAARPDDLPDAFADRRGGHFGCAFAAGEIGIVVPDLRGERTRERVMGDAGWRSLEDALRRMEGCRHVLIMSSVPLVNTEMSKVERFLVALPGHSGVEDDLRDQWQSFGHREEWRRMLSLLVDFCERTGARVTSLSGEIHLGALGLVEGRDVKIHELTSSAIVNPPPPSAVVMAYDWLGRRTIRLAPDLKACLLKIPGHGHRYLRERNWLVLDAAGDGGFLGAWQTERGEAGRLVVSADVQR